MIEAGKVVCPGHTWAWDPATGATSEPQERVAVYPVSVEGEDIFREGVSWVQNPCVSRSVRPSHGTLHRESSPQGNSL